MKQETLEEFINKSNTPEGLDQFSYDKGLEDGAKWQQARMYSEEDMTNYTIYVLNNNVITPKQWFKKYKKK